MKTKSVALLNISVYLLLSWIASISIRVHDSVYMKTDTCRSQYIFSRKEYYRRKKITWGQIYIWWICYCEIFNHFQWLNWKLWDGVSILVFIDRSRWEVPQSVHHHTRVSFLSFLRPSHTEYTRSIWNGVNIQEMKTIWINCKDLYFRNSMNAIQTLFYCPYTINAPTNEKRTLSILNPCALLLNT